MGRAKGKRKNSTQSHERRKGEEEKQKHVSEFTRKILGEWVTTKHGILTDELVFLEDGTFASITGIDRNVESGAYEVIDGSRISFNNGAFLGQVKWINKNRILISIGDNDHIMDRK